VCHTLNKYKPGISSGFPHPETSVKISWLLAKGKVLSTQGERRSSNTDPELAEMLETNEEIVLSPWKKSTVRALKCHTRFFAKQRLYNNLKMENSSEVVC